MNYTCILPFVSYGCETCWMNGRLGVFRFPDSQTGEVKNK